MIHYMGRYNYGWITVGTEHLWPSRFLSLVLLHQIAHKYNKHFGLILHCVRTYVERFSAAVTAAATKHLASNLAMLAPAVN